MAGMSKEAAFRGKLVQFLFWAERGHEGCE